MSHYDDALDEHNAKIRAERRAVRERVRNDTDHPLAELARILGGCRFTFGAEAEQHLQQKLRELRCLIADYAR